MSKEKKNKLLLDVELKDLNEKNGLVTFYFAAWNEDLDRDIILKTAYNKTFKENKNNIYHNRDHSTAVGMPISFGVDENGAFAVSQLAMKTIAGRDTFEQYQAGLIKGHSQEFQTIIDEYDSSNGVRTIKEVHLWGVTSVTHVPANLDTPTISMKSFEDAADQLAKINKLLTTGNISDELGERMLKEYKSLSEFIETKSKKIVVVPEKKAIDWNALVNNL